MTKNFGEKEAQTFLVQNGFEIVECNYRTREGEIDIIAQKKGSTHFIEVKQRAFEGFGDPEEFVTLSKQRKLKRAAQAYLDSIDGFGCTCQFDVIAVTGTPESFKLEYFPNAF
jgi:putative endonuclease